MSESVTTETQIVTSKSSGFVGTLSGKYDLVIIDVYAMTELYFIVHTTLSSELKTYHVIVTCVNCVCCTCYTVISAFCIFRLYINFKMNLFISIILSAVLCWVQKKSIFNKYVVTNTAHST